MSPRRIIAANADVLREALAAHRPSALPGRRLLRGAAVAVVVAPSEDGPRVLLIRRTERPGDRWSGDLAFPGGLARAGETLGATARREAGEEVGLALGEPTGRLGDRLSVEPARRRPMIVRPVVFLHAADRPVAIDPREVEEAFFVSLAQIAESHRSFGLLGPRRIPAPYRRVFEHRLWGLSLAIMEELLTISSTSIR